jgi:hypothetical protein
MITYNNKQRIENVKHTCSMRADKRTDTLNQGCTHMNTSPYAKTLLMFIVYLYLNRILQSRQ